MVKKVWEAGEEITADALNHTDMGLKALAQASPNMTLAVDRGMVKFITGILKYAGGNSPTFTAPSTNPRIDILTLDSAGTLAVTQGTENASPVAPSYPVDKFVVCEVYLRVGATSIKNIDDGSQCYIYFDARPFNLFTESLYSASHSAGAYTISNGLSAYFTGMIVRFLPAATNAGAATLNINSLGAKAIKKNGSNALDPGDLYAGQVAVVQYDGTNFQLLNRGTFDFVIGASSGTSTADTTSTHTYNSSDENYNFTNCRLTMKVAGNFAFRMNYGGYSGGNYATAGMKVYKNGTEVNNKTYYSSSWQSSGMTMDSDSIAVAAGDVIDLYFYFSTYSYGYHGTVYSFSVLCGGYTYGIKSKMASITITPASVLVAPSGILAVAS